MIQLELLSKNYKEFFYRAVLKFFEGILMQKRGNVEKGRELAQRMLTVMWDLDQEPVAEIYALLLAE